VVTVPESACAIEDKVPPTTTTPIPASLSVFSIENGSEHVDKQIPVCAAPPDKTKSVDEVTPTVFVGATHPTCVADAGAAFEEAVKVVDEINQILTRSFVAFAAGEDTTDRNPAVSVVTATNAMRCLIVFVDIISFR